MAMVRFLRVLFGFVQNLRFLLVPILEESYTQHQIVSIGVSYLYCSEVASRDCPRAFSTFLMYTPSSALFLSTLEVVTIS